MIWYSFCKMYVKPKPRPCAPHTGAPHIGTPHTGAPHTGASRNRVGEIYAFAEISTSHTTVRTVPYTAVQST